MRKDESSKILSNDWKELIVEDEKTKEKLVIINSDGVEITSSDLNVRLVPKVEINPKVCYEHTKEKLYEKRKCHQGKNSEGKGTNGASKCAFNDRWKRTC